MKSETFPMPEIFNSSLGDFFKLFVIFFFMFFFLLHFIINSSSVVMQTIIQLLILTIVYKVTCVSWPQTYGTHLRAKTNINMIYTIAKPSCFSSRKSATRHSRLCIVHTICATCATCTGRNCQNVKFCQLWTVRNIAGNGILCLIGKFGYPINVLQDSIFSK